MTRRSAARTLTLLWFITLSACSSIESSGRDGAVPAKETLPHGDSITDEASLDVRSAADALDLWGDGPALPAWPAFTDRGVIFENRFTVAGYGEVLSIASDPTAVVTEGRVHLVFTCLHFDLDPPATMLCHATSSDSRVFSTNPSPIPGELLRGAVGTRRERLEAAALAIDGDGMQLLYSAYPGAATADPASGFPADLYLTQIPKNGDPVLSTKELLPRTTGGFDHHAIYSPTLARDQNGWTMLYAGHCYPGVQEVCQGTSGGVSLLRATAPTIAGPWSKQGEVAFINRPSWMGGFVAEPALVKVEGGYLLFLTAFDDEKPKRIGIARSKSLLGPWSVMEQPVLEAQADGTLVVAPTAIVFGDSLVVYYTHIPKDGIQRIGLLEAKLK